MATVSASIQDRRSDVLIVAGNADSFRCAAEVEAVRQRKRFHQESLPDLRLSGKISWYVGLAGTRAWLAMGYRQLEFFVYSVVDRVVGIAVCTGDRA